MQNFNSRKWYVAAPFIKNKSDVWLSDFVLNKNNDFLFEKIVANYSHNRSRKSAGYHAWMDYWVHGSNTWNIAKNTKNKCGVLSCFPQLATILGVRKKLTNSNIPIVAWNFNLGELYPGLKKVLSRNALSTINIFAVHSRAEIQAYSEWLNIEPEKFQFVPLQRAVSSIDFSEDFERPFILSMGSAHRDYQLLFKVLDDLKYPAIIVAATHAIQGLKIPENVEIRSGLTSKQCDELVQRARVSVVPIANKKTASGQVTFLDAMMYGRPTIVTECAASVDYIVHEKDAMLVRQGDYSDLKNSIERLWQDEELRISLSNSARRTVIDKFSDEAVGRELGKILATLR